MPRFLVALLLACLLTPATWAQDLAPASPAAPAAGVTGGLAPPAAAQKKGDPLMDRFFPAEALMQHAAKLGLSAEQQQALLGEMQQAQARFLDLQWQLYRDQQILVDLVKGDRVDEKAALLQMSKVMKIEDEIKLVRLTLAIRMKNALTAAQQEQLRMLAQGSPGPGAQPARPASSTEPATRPGDASPAPRPTPTP